MSFPNNVLHRHRRLVSSSPQTDDVTTLLCPTSWQVTLEPRSVCYLLRRQWTSTSKRVSENAPVIGGFIVMCSVVSFIVLSALDYVGQERYPVLKWTAYSGMFTKIISIIMFVDVSINSALHRILLGIGFFQAGAQNSAHCILHPGMLCMFGCWY